MKNSLVFLNIEGVGLNPRIKGNYFKLVKKPNLNYLISGLYPWSIITNESSKKKSKNSLRVSKDIDKNFYQTLLGNREIKTVNDRFDELFESKTVLDLPIFDKLQKHCQANKSYVHLFFLLSSNTFHIKKNHINLIINAILKKNLKVILHVIADGKDCLPFSFSNEINDFFKFTMKRKVPIGTIAGRDHVFIKEGHKHSDCEHVTNYFNHVIGLGKNYFEIPTVYAEDNLFEKVHDNLIEPASNKNIYKNFVSENDAVLFLDSDPDAFSSLAYKLVNEKNGKFKNLFVGSLLNVYGLKNVHQFYESESIENSITEIAAKHQKNSIVISLPHKKGFIEKMYGKNKNELIDRKAIILDNCKSTHDYIFLVNKLLVDKAIKSISHYDLIVIHNPLIAEIAKMNDLDLLRFALESFDKNLGRLINYTKATGNNIALLSTYGVVEKMVNRKFFSTPYNKKSPTFFVFTNGDLSSKSLHSDFTAVYSTILTTLGINITSSASPSLVTESYNKDNLTDKYISEYQVWKDDFALPMVKAFEENRLSLYNDLEKNEQYLNEKQNYIVIKEIFKIHENRFTTAESRKKIYEYLLDYVKYNNIDFEDFKYSIAKYLTTMFDQEILLQKSFRSSQRYLEDRAWLKKIRKSNKWVSKIKTESNPIVKRDKVNKSFESVNKIIKKSFEPYLFFEKLFTAEKEIFERNSAVDVVNFYELIKDEVQDVYNTYFLPRIRNLNEDIDLFEESDIDEAEMEIPFKYFKITSYMDLFNEILSVISSHKDKALMYDMKIQEVLKTLDEPSDHTSIFNKPSYEVNGLLRQILPIYRMWLNEIKTTQKQHLTKLRQSINNYNIKYDLKVKDVESKLVYDGEFLEQVDVSKQDKLKHKLQEKVHKIGLFDTPSLDKSEEVQRHDEFLHLLSTVDTDVEDLENEVTPVDKVRFRPIYDLTSQWTQERLEEIRNSEVLNADPFKEASQTSYEYKKMWDAEKQIKTYFENSSLWKDNIQGVKPKDVSDEE